MASYDSYSVAIPSNSDPNLYWLYPLIESTLQIYSKVFHSLLGNLFFFVSSLYSNVSSSVASSGHLYTLVQPANKGHILRHTYTKIESTFICFAQIFITLQRKSWSRVPGIVPTKSMSSCGSDENLRNSR